MDSSAYLKEMGRKIAIIRERRKVSQMELSKRTGISQCNISHVECGLKSVRILTLKLFADALNVDVKDFL